MMSGYAVFFSCRGFASKVSQKYVISAECVLASPLPDQREYNGMGNIKTGVEIGTT